MSDVLAVKKMLSREIVRTARDCFDIIFNDAVLDFPKDSDHGDYASTVAMQVGKKVGRDPLEVAEEFCKRLEGVISEVDRVEVAGAGFLNFYLKTGIFF